MKEGSLEKLPEYLDNPTDSPYTSVLSNSQFGFTNLRVVKGGIIYHEEPLGLSVFGKTVTIRHDLGKAYDVFLRVNEIGTDTWYTLPSQFEQGGTLGSIRYIDIFDINEETLILDCFNAGSIFSTNSAPVRFEAIFVEFFI